MFRACALAAMVAFPPAVHAQLHAERITRDTAPDLLIGGTQATGGVGDWYLANDRVEIIVNDPASTRGELTHGGTLVDAGLRDRRGEDQLGQVLPVVNLKQQILLQFDTIRAEVDRSAGQARLVVSNSRGLDSVLQGRGLDGRLMVPPPEKIRDVVVETEYRVQMGEPYVHLITTITNRGMRSAPVFSYSDVFIHGQRGPRAWYASTLAPEQSRGFRHTSFSVGNIMNVGEAIEPITYAVFPGVRQYAPIAYGLCAPDRAAEGRPLFALTDGHVGPITAFIFDPAWDRLSLLRLVRGTQRGLAPGASWTYHRLFLVGPRGDVASISDTAFALLGVVDGTTGIVGTVAPADVPHVIHIKDATTGAPATQVSPPTSGFEAGRYRVQLPPGNYALEIRAPQRPTVYANVTVRVGAFADAGTHRLDEPGWLEFDPAFADGGPGRVIVRGEGKTATPIFNPEMLEFRLDGELEDAAMETDALYFVGTAADPRSVAIPPGTYRLMATRGLEHGIDTQVVHVTAPGQHVRVPPFQPPRVIELPGYVAADFHVHGEASDDSAISNDMRLRTFVAEGVDVLVSTEHDNVTNFEPTVEALGVAEYVRVIQGAEVTGTAPSRHAPWTVGHTNVWPIAYDPLAPHHGAPPSENRWLADIYATARRDYGAAVVQMNHPKYRGNGSSGPGDAFMEHMGAAGAPFNADLPITEAPNNYFLRGGQDGHTRAIDFDAIEVMNWRVFPNFVSTRRDWYALHRQGYHRTGTANSDTHGPRKEAGYPRNYVYYPPGLEGWDMDTFNAAVRAGRLFGTTGPLFVRFTANEGMMGDTVPAPDGHVTVGVTVAAAPWVPVPEVRLVINGEVVSHFTDLPALDGAPVIRYEDDIQVTVTADSFITVEAGAPLPESLDALPPPPEGVYGTVVSRKVFPMAFTNPIFIDVDGNGQYDPPIPPPVAPGWFNVSIPWYVFGVVVAFMVIALLIARRQP